MITLKSPSEVARMRESGRIVAEVLAILTEKAVPGATTAELDAIAEACIRKNGAVPAFLGYGSTPSRPGFPGSICASINEEVVHGIPGPRELREGDLLSVDVGTLKDGYFGDAAKTIGVGRVDPEAARLMRVCRESLERGIEKARAGSMLAEVSAAIQRHAEANGYSVVRKFVGHGIGTEMHEDPQIPNYVAPGFAEVELKPGMTLAIEPMINEGTHRVQIGHDGWTVVTSDRRRSAHWEHTVVVTAGEAEILTVSQPQQELEQ